MKNNVFLLTTLGLMGFVSACTSTDSEVSPEVENEHVRLLVTSSIQNNLTYRNLKEGNSQTFSVSEKNPSVYTVSGRFAYLIHREANKVEVFDSGIETHGDHIHIKGTPKMAALQVSEGQPTHFFAQGDKAVIFNDGTGSVTIIEEEQIHKEGYQPTVVKAAVAHHGAAVLFSNNTLAVTDRLPDYNGSSPVLPTTVRIVDLQGKQVVATSIKVAGIHGEAFNGTYAAFGSTDGVILVDKLGKSRVVPHTQELQNANVWLGSLVGHEDLPHFYGYSSRKGGGVFRIDPAKNEMTPLLKTDVLASVKLSRDARNLVILLKNGTIQVYDARTGTKKIERTGVIADFSSLVTGEGVIAPNLDMTPFGIYISDPQNQYVKVIHLHTLADIQTVSLSNVARVLMLGMI